MPRCVPLPEWRKTRIPPPRMVEALALVLTVFALGLVSQRFGAMPEQAPEALNRFVIEVCVPAAVLYHVPHLELRPSLVLLVATPWLLTALSVPLVLGASRAFGWSRGTEAALLLTVPLGNTSFIGYPMVRALLSEQHMPLAVVYDQLGSFVLLSTYGVFVVARYEGGTTPTPRAMLGRLVRFPPIVALVVALVPFPHPAALDVVLQAIAQALVPVAVFAVALKMRVGLPREPGPLAFGLIAKMAVLPALAFGLARLVGAERAVLEVSVFESAMPPMITAGALAIAAGLGAELASSVVGYGVLLSLVWLPLVAKLLG